MTWGLLAKLMLLMAVSGTAAAQRLVISSVVESERHRIGSERQRVFKATQSHSLPITEQTLPSPAALAREQQTIEQERKALFDPNNPATQGWANAFPAISTPQRSGVDIEALARRYERKSMARHHDELMVFASFTMPTESLKRLIRQANQVGASVMLRGFKKGIDNLTDGLR